MLYALVHSSEYYRSCLKRDTISPAIVLKYDPFEVNVIVWSGVLLSYAGVILSGWPLLVKVFTNLFVVHDAVHLSF